MNTGHFGNQGRYTITKMFNGDGVDVHLRLYPMELSWPVLLLIIGMVLGLFKMLFVFASNWI